MQNNIPFNESPNLSFHSAPFVQKSPNSLKKNIITFDKDISIIKSDDIDISVERKEDKTPKSKSSINFEKYMYIFCDNRDLNINSNKKHHVSFLDYDGDITNMKKENVNSSFNNVFLDE
jgi:hypothetical protein